MFVQNGDRGSNPYGGREEERERMYVPKTHCPQGHDYSDPTVLYADTRGKRICRICKNANFRRWYARQKGKDHDHPM